MINLRTLGLAFLVATLSLAVSFDLAFAAFKSGLPSGKFGQPPYGLNVEGGAAGDKLNGVIQISFTDVGCYEELKPTYTCGPNNTTPNGAKARATLRLSRTNTNSDDDTQAFYVDLVTPQGFDVVSIEDEGFVQYVVTQQLEPMILEAFFDGNTFLDIYLKEFALIEQVRLDGDSSPNADFTVIADVVLAVK